MTLLILDPWQSFICFIRSGVKRCTHLILLYLDRMCQCGLHAVHWSHIGTLMHRLAAEPRSTAGLLLPSRCPCGMILLTPYSMVWDWRVSRAGPILFYWPKMLYPFCNLLLFFPSLLSVYRLVLWDWGLRTDRVYITLSQPCTADLFLIIIITISIYLIMYGVVVHCDIKHIRQFSVHSRFIEKSITVLILYNVYSEGRTSKSEKWSTIIAYS